MGKPGSMEILTGSNKVLKTPIGSSQAFSGPIASRTHIANVAPISVGQVLHQVVHVVVDQVCPDTPPMDPWVFLYPKGRPT